MLPAMSTIEKRRQVRYPALDGTIVALNPKAEILGQMIDIGPGGLSFRYIESVIDPAPTTELVILLDKPRFYLDKLPYRKANDYEMPSEFIFSVIPVRRMGVEFGDLTAAQRKQLENFISVCSANNASVK